MTQAHSPNKTLKQYRRDQEDEKRGTTGSDWEDLLLSAPLHQALPEQALWRAVLLQMITDALSNSQKKDNLRHKRDALHWLKTHSRDFRLVCDYAGYDPRWMQEQIDRFFKEHRLNAPAPQPYSPPTKPEAGFSIHYGSFSMKHNHFQAPTMTELELNT